jgi:hypothetical protein
VVGNQEQFAAANDFNPVISRYMTVNVKSRSIASLRPKQSQASEQRSTQNRAIIQFQGSSLE